MNNLILSWENVLNSLKIALNQTSNYILNNIVYLLIFIFAILIILYSFKFFSKLYVSVLDRINNTFFELIFFLSLIVIVILFLFFFQSNKQNNFSSNIVLNSNPSDEYIQKGVSFYCFDKKKDGDTTYIKNIEKWLENEKNIIIECMIRAPISINGSEESYAFREVNRETIKKLLKRKVEFKIIYN